MHNATVQQPLITVSPNSNPTIVMLQAEAGSISKHNVVPFRCLFPSFIAPLVEQMPVVSSQGSKLWEVGGRPRSVTSVAAEFGFAHSIISRLWRQFQTTGTAIRGFSSGRPRGTTPAYDRYIVLQARRNRRQTAGEITRHTTQATGRPISRFTVARRLHGGGLFARRLVRCVPLTPAHRRRRSLWCREHRNWRDNEWGRVLFTDESRFSLSSDSHRILIWRERGSRNHPRTSLKGTGMEVAVFSFGEASCLVVV
ncbi:transposable element Tcb2 transposase [Trichonephila clavipes]|nr:transposable element Tcb2 transposase [Trichonephila clavipes]